MERFSDQVRQYAVLTDEQAAQLDEAAAKHDTAHPQFAVAAGRALSSGDAGMFRRFGLSVDEKTLAEDRFKAVHAALKREAKKGAAEK